MNFEPNEQVITPLEKTIPNNTTCSRRIPTILLVCILQARHQLNPNNATSSRRIPNIFLVWILQARNQLTQSRNRILNTSKLKMLQTKRCCSNHLELAATPQQQPNERLKVQHIR